MDFISFVLTATSVFLHKHKAYTPRMKVALCWVIPNGKKEGAASCGG